MSAAQADAEKTADRILDFDLSAELNHGIVVSNLAYEVASELGLEQESRYELAVAGMLHDIGKLKLTEYNQRTRKGSSSDRGAKICAYAFYSGL